MNAINTTATPGSALSSHNKQSGYIPHLSKRHFVAPARVRTTTACLSVFGSCIILFMIYRRRKQVPTATYIRLMIMISVWDIFTSFAYIASTAPVPKGTHIPGARGNTATCTAQGFVFQMFSRGASFYNACLMIFYVLVIRYSWRPRDIARLVEPLMHAISILFPLGVAIAALFLDIYNPAAGGPTLCWFGDYPIGCSTNPNMTCQRGQDFQVYYTWLSIAPRYGAMIIFVVCIVIIFFTVQRQAASNDKYGVGSPTQSNFNAETVSSVRRQCYLYGINFIASYLFSSIIVQMRTREVYKHNPRIFYCFVMLAAIFTPLQGLINLAIFIMPRYDSIRRRIPGRSWWWALWMTIASDKDAKQLGSKTSGSGEKGDDTGRDGHGRVNITAARPLQYGFDGMSSFMFTQRLASDSALFDHGKDQGDPANGQRESSSCIGLQPPAHTAKSQDEKRWSNAAMNEVLRSIELSNIDESSFSDDYDGDHAKLHPEDRARTCLPSLPASHHQVEKVDQELGNMQDSHSNNFAADSGGVVAKSKLADFDAVGTCSIQDNDEKPALGPKDTTDAMMTVSK